MALVIHAYRIVEKIGLYFNFDWYLMCIVMVEWVDHELWSHAELKLSRRKRRGSMLSNG